MRCIFIDKDRVFERHTNAMNIIRIPRVAEYTASMLQSKPEEMKYDVYEYQGSFMMENGKVVIYKRTN